MSTLPAQRYFLLPPTFGFSASRSVTTSSRSASMKRRGLHHFETLLPFDLTFIISSKSFLSMKSSSVIKPSFFIAWFQTRYCQSVNEELREGQGYDHCSFRMQCSMYEISASYENYISTPPFIQAYLFKNNLNEVASSCQRSGSSAFYQQSR